MAKRDLKWEVDQLKHRVDELEGQLDQVPPRKSWEPIPTGRYKGKIVDVNRQQAFHSHRYYWNIKILITEGVFEGYYVWANRVERIPSPIEQLCSTFGTKLESVWQEEPISWTGPQPTGVLDGRECWIIVRQNRIRDRLANEVTDITPVHD